VCERIVVAVLALCLSAIACATTYTYTGSNYNFVSPPYTTSMSITGSITTASPLPANMPISDIGPNGTNLVTAWSFNDGINTYTKANSVPLPQGGTFRIGTDASGNISSFYIQIEQPLPPHIVGQLLNVLDVVNIGFNQSQSITGAPCLTLTGNVCATLGSGTSFGDSTSSGAFAPVTGPPTIAKAFGAGSIPVGGSTSLSFTLTNPNSGASLSGIGFTDSLPAGLVVSTPNGLTGSCGGGTITAVAGSGSVSLTGATLAASGSCTFSANVTATTTGIKNNTTSAVTSTEGGTGGTASASVTVATATLPPTIAKSFGAATIVANTFTSLSFTIQNPNGATTLTGIGFTDSLPAGLVVSTPNGLTGSCGGGVVTAAAGSGSVSLTGATLAGGSSCTFSANVTGTTTGAKNNTTSAVTSVEGGSGATASASVTVIAAPAAAATIPTLQQWALVLLSLLLLVGVAVELRAHKS
jgi:hypothetical protein